MVRRSVARGMALCVVLLWSLPVWGLMPPEALMELGTTDSSVDLAWSRIHALNQSGTSYNLLYRPGSVYLVPRSAQGSYQHAAWTAGFAWAEIAGSFTTFNAGDYQSLSAEQILAEYGKLGLSPHADRSTP